MTILLFVSYKFRNNVMNFSQGYLTNVWILEAPEDFPQRMAELATELKEYHSTDVVIIENISMQEWKNAST